MRRSVKAASACVLGTLLIAGAAGCATTSDSVVSPPDSPAAGGALDGGEWVAGSGDQNFSEAVADYAAYDQPYRASMTTLVSTWRQKAAAGTPVKVIDSPSEEPSDFTVQDADETLSLLKAAPALNKAELPRPASDKQGPANSSTATTSPRSVGGYDPHNPNTYAVLGNRSSDHLYWENMPFEFWTQKCDSGGCHIVDKWTSRVRITPGPTSALYTGNSTHFPSGGSINDIHFDNYAVCRGTVCGTSDVHPSPGGLHMLLHYTESRWSNVVTNAAILWAYFPAQSRWLDSAAKTHDALCEAKSAGNQCRYIQ